MDDSIKLHPPWPAIKFIAIAPCHHDIMEMPSVIIKFDMVIKMYSPGISAERQQLQGLYRIMNMNCNTSYNDGIRIYFLERYAVQYIVCSEQNQVQVLIISELTATTSRSGLNTTPPVPDLDVRCQSAIRPRWNLLELSVSGDCTTERP